MSHHSELIATDIDAYLAEHEQKELLRFITCGSVDDGKSTLIGRLFCDSKMIYEDQLAAIESASQQGSTGGKFDPALFTDGLKEEREQGITIDVAYRYFSTSKRKFIIADTPGHVQYTRNMATGASTADLAVILVDARHGILEQTRRHSFIVTLLGIKHVLVAVNKMDLVDFSQEVYEQLQREYREFAARLDIPDLHFIPISALNGDNVVDASPQMPWYDGPTFLSFLNNIYIGSDRNLQDLRFPVQWVNRPNLDFRGFCGTVASGIVRRGDEIMVLPSRKTSRVKDIVTYGGSLEEAFAPMSVTLTLEDEVDVSRGDMLVRPGNLPKVEQQFDANLVWMGEQPMVPGKEYVFKQATKQVTGSVSTLRYQIDVNTLHRAEAPALNLNEIGRVAIKLNQPICFDRYKRNRNTGAFIVIDRITNVTVGAGMILDRDTADGQRDFWEEESGHATLEKQLSQVTENERQQRFGQLPVTVLFTGLPGAGKSTTAYGVERALFEIGRAAMVLDGQNIRLGLSRDLDFSDQGRSENLRRTAEVARLLNQSGQICLMAMVAPDEKIRQRAAQVVGADRFFVVHLNASGEVCQQRHSGLRQQVDEQAEVPPEYEPPSQPDLVIDTAQVSPTDAVKQVVEMLTARNVLG